MLTDTAGQEEYRGLWAASNLRSDAFLLVYDITNANSLDALDYFMDMIDMETEQRLDNGGVPPVKIVAGNKCDLQGARQIKSPQGLEWARKRKCGFMETSAREMVNIEETFARMCDPLLPRASLFAYRMLYSPLLWTFFGGDRSQDTVKDAADPIDL
jgi:GTPase KRas protein